MLPETGFMMGGFNDESLIRAAENSFSLREKARMRGYEIKRLSCFILSPRASPEVPPKRA
jgi:hypothetical protein